MKKLIAVVAGEPNSINSEIIGKAWKKFRNKEYIFIIGNYLLLKKQINKIGLRIKIKKINSIVEIKDKKNLHILDIPFKFNSLFRNKSAYTRNYVLSSLNAAHDLAYTHQINGFINAAIDKKIFNNKYLGVTEYLSNKNKKSKDEVMMIYNKKFSVVPLTTHLEIKDITSRIKPDLIRKKIITLNGAYYKLFNRKPKIIILGLNPHNSENRKGSIEDRIIKPTVEKLRKLNINIQGPFPADTVFDKQKKIGYDVIVGMYHDQVLAPFKALYGFDAINITLGLNYLRISPDHGTALDIVGLNRANPLSLITAIKFLKKFND